MANITNSIDGIVKNYVNGTLTKEEANAKLEALGTDIRVTDENRTPAVATVVDGVINGDVLLDMGLGVMNKVHVINNVLQNADMGTMHVLAIVNDTDVYEVKGDKIGAYKGKVKK